MEALSACFDERARALIIVLVGAARGGGGGGRLAMSHLGALEDLPRHLGLPAPPPPARPRSRSCADRKRPRKP